MLFTIHAWKLDTKKSAEKRNSSNYVSGILSSNMIASSCKTYCAGNKNSTIAINLLFFYQVMTSSYIYPTSPEEDME